jgi:Ca2+-binding EF-hand superfamily protein
MSSTTTSSIATPNQTTRPTTTASSVDSRPTSSATTENSRPQSSASSLKARNNDEISLYTTCFRLFEGKNKGHIETKDLGPLMRICLFSPSDRQLKEYLLEMDLVADEYIPLDQFLLLVGRLDLPVIESKNELILSFEIWDPDQRGYVTVSTMRNILANHGDPADITPEEIEEIMNTFAEDIPPIPQQKKLDQTTSSTSNTATPEPQQQELPEKVIYYDKFLRACLSNVTIHEKPVKKKKRSKSKSPVKR